MGSIPIRCTKFYAGVLLGEDSAFQADGEGSNPFARSNLSRCSIMALRWSPKPVMAVRIRPPRPVLLGVSLVRSKALVFEIRITGSNPVPLANQWWL